MNKIFQNPCMTREVLANLDEVPQINRVALKLELARLDQTELTLTQIRIGSKPACLSLTYQEAQQMDLARFRDHLSMLHLKTKTQFVLDGYCRPCPLEQLVLLTHLTRLTCFYVPGIQFPETLTELFLDLDTIQGPKSIPYPRGLRKLSLTKNLLHTLGPGLPCLEALGVSSPWNPNRPNRFNQPFSLTGDWPQSLARVDNQGGTLVLQVSPDWPQRHPKLTHFGFVRLQTEFPPWTRSVKVNNWESPFSGLVQLTHLHLSVFNMTEHQCYQLLDQVKGTLESFEIQSKIPFEMGELPFMPRLTQLNMGIQPPALTKLGTWIPKAKSINISTLCMDVDHLILKNLPGDCQFLSLNILNCGPDLRIMFQGPCPPIRSLQIICTCRKARLLGPFPKSLRRLSSKGVHAFNVPEWVYWHGAKILKLKINSPFL